jgi:uncharacterized protein YjiS (DUF1127 family)
MCMPFNPRAFERAHTPPLWGPTVALKVMAHAAKRFVQALRRRADVAMLAGFDDRMLADIGLTRADVRDAFSEPLWRDPSALLARRAAERRSGRALRVANAARAPSIIPDEGTPARAPVA